jgi:hypothetical protein
MSRIADRQSASQDVLSFIELLVASLTKTIEKEANERRFKITFLSL